MAQQDFNVGTIADDNTGDTLRGAFIKAGANFDELYARDYYLADFGVYNADGVTDDSSVIQTAIDAIEAAGGGTLHFPIGTFAVSTALTLNGNGVKLIGKGSDKTIIKSTSNSVKCLRVGSLSTSSSGKSSDLAIKGIRFEGTSAATVEAVEIYGTTRIFVNECDFYRGENALSVRNSDQFMFLHNKYRVTASGKIGLNLIQGSADDVTTGSFIGGIIDVTGTNGICIQFSDGSGGTPNEFNNIIFQGIKLDGNNIAGVTGVKGITGCRNVQIINCEFKELRGYGVDYVTALLDGQKVYMNIASCKMLGNSTNPSLAHVYVKQPVASGSRTIITVNNTQLHRAASAILASSGSPYIYFNHVDCSNLTNLLEIESGATPKFVIGMNEIGGSVTNNEGTVLAAAALSHIGLAERAAGDWTA